MGRSWVHWFTPTMFFQQLLLSTRLDMHKHEKITLLSGIGGLGQQHLFLQWRKLGFPELAFNVMSKYISIDEVPSEDLLDMCKRSAVNFRTEGWSRAGLSMVLACARLYICSPRSAGTAQIVAVLLSPALTVIGWYPGLHYVSKPQERALISKILLGNEYCFGGVDNGCGVQGLFISCNCSPTINARW